MEYFSGGSCGGGDYSFQPEEYFGINNQGRRPSTSGWPGWSTCLLQEEASLSNMFIINFVVDVITDIVIINIPPSDIAVSKKRERVSIERIVCIADQEEWQVTAMRLWRKSQKPTSAWLRCMLQLREISWCKVTRSVQPVSWCCLGVSPMVNASAFLSTEIIVLLYQH